MIASVAIYCLCLGAPTLLLLPYAVERRRPPLSLLLLAYLPTVILAAIRGDVGTDTAMYRVFFENIQEASLLELESLFRLFLLACRAVSDDSQAFLVAQALACWVLYCWACNRLEVNGALLSFALLPSLMIDSTFNGMRYGLAYAAGALVLSFPTAHFGIKGIASRLLPGLVHVSMLVLLVNRFSTGVLLALAIAIALYFVGIENLTNLDYFLWKYGEYSDVGRPSWYSGAMPMIQFIILSAVWLLPPREGSGYRHGYWLNYLGSALFLAGIAVSGFTYAGLRLAGLGIFLLTVGLTTSMARSDWTRLKILLLLALSLLTSGNLLRQFVQMAGTDTVKFIPYSTQWGIW